MDSAQAEKPGQDLDSWRRLPSHPVTTGLCLSVSPIHPCGSEDRRGLRTLPPAGMKEPPARPFCPPLRKIQPSLRCQHPQGRPWRQEDLGTGVAEAPHKSKGLTINRPADLPPLFLPSVSFLSFYFSGRR